ncbi:hypothetical protein [Clostridium botulinum]|uniref:hypothetical protein n=1 Tax=Clostridium botulinum TaxID=1491 RepID=UPI0003717750|nr:hypothetical protein [Clostridium botulinum]
MIQINTPYLRSATGHLTNQKIADYINQSFGTRYNDSSISKLHTNKRKNLKLLKLYCECFSLDINKAVITTSNFKIGFE